MNRLVIGVFILQTASSLFAQQGQIRGEVVDPSAASVPSAQVTVSGPQNVSKAATTNETGAWQVDGLLPGRYSVRIVAPGFTPFEIRNVKIDANQHLSFKTQLVIASQTDTVTVADQEAVTVDPSSTAGAIVLKGEALEALSDNPDDLASDLQALAGPAAGPNGGEIFVDGFSGGKLPPKSAIREVRINQNPFSAEYDRMGFGRIEVFTKPGSDRIRGGAFFSFGDRYLNSRNPFSPTRAPYQSRNYGVEIGGPISKKSSYFLDVERRETDENAVVNATILDSNLSPLQYQQAFVTPIRRLSVSPRFDYQLTPKVTLVGRYRYSTLDRDNMGIGEFTLPSRATSSNSDDHSLQLTETAVLNAKTINETRFQYLRANDTQLGDNLLPGITVLDAFSSGGSSVGSSGTTSNHYEIHNLTSRSQGTHFIKFGGRVRYSSSVDRTDQNFNGSFTFTGGLAPVLDANNQALDGQFEQITSIERYRRTLLFQSLGLSALQIRALGGGANQFTLSSGLAAMNVNQVDLGLFAEDSWRIRPTFTLNYGLRYETQNNIHDYRDFAPRVSIAWGMDGRGGKPTKTVLRAGVGTFYDRISDSLTLQARRFNGLAQQQYYVLNPDFYPNVPSADTLAQFRQDATVRQLAGDLRTPYIQQGVIGVDRQLPFSTSISANFVYSRGEHMLRTVNTNAPVNGVRPIPDAGNIYTYESSGILRQKQLMVNMNSRFSRKVMLFGFYVYGHANSDTDGAGSFPSNPYDFTTEYGRASYDVRHRFVMGGSLRAKWGFTLNPFIMASSGTPFNITTGRDNNGDTIFNDRPSLATSTGVNVKDTVFGVFNLTPGLNDTIIPRNYGQGPGQFSVNMRLSRTWGFGSKGGATQASGGPMEGPPMGGPGGPGGGGPRGGGMGGPGGGGGGFRGGRGGGGPFDAGSTEKRFNLTFSASARNLLNYVNLSSPVGNLSSALFGQSTSLGGGFGGPGGGGPGGFGASGAGNRRLELQLRLSF